ncbi:DUF6988 family protein [Pseudomonas gingeri]|uniref:Uncharacterized protein n=1 Tax=Pseudomonas gingeri TaxID=117681 RepID=A0A7Y7WJU9_9PSED|nr:hypothetical protein [Pseudomonas gingeri]NWB50598.1 hypothetical protein [Pseudomonas gingeri]
MSQEEINRILAELKTNYELVQALVRADRYSLDTEYKKINYTYYRMFCSHYEAFVILVEGQYFSSSIVLLRTMLELFVKSFYLQFIEQDKGSKVTDFLMSEKNFPSFFKMVSDLESYKPQDYKGFEGAFSQFTKANLASYEKYSLFSHGRGELLKRYYETNRIAFSTQDVHDVLLTANGLFEMLSLLLFAVQGSTHHLGMLLQRINGREKP